MQRTNEGRTTSPPQTLGIVNYNVVQLRQRASRNALTMENSWRRNKLGIETTTKVFKRYIFKVFTDHCCIGSSPDQSTGLWISPSDSVSRHTPQRTNEGRTTSSPRRLGIENGCGCNKLGDETIRVSEMKTVENMIQIVFEGKNKPQQSTCDTLTTNQTHKWNRSHLQLSNNWKPSERVERTDNAKDLRGPLYTTVLLNVFCGRGATLPLGIRRRGQRNNNTEVIKVNTRAVPEQSVSRTTGPLCKRFRFKNPTSPSLRDGNVKKSQRRAHREFVQYVKRIPTFQNRLEYTKPTKPSFQSDKTTSLLPLINSHLTFRKATYQAYKQ